MAKIKKFLTVVMCFLIAPFSIFAANAGGTGSQGGASGNTGSGSTATNFFWQQDTDKEVRVAAYRFDLVYKPKNGNRYILKTVIAQDTSGGGGSYCSSQAMAISHVKKYAKTVNELEKSTKYGAVYKNSGPLVDLAKRLTNGEVIDKIFNNNMLRDETVIKNYITSANGFNMDEDELHLEQDDNPGNINSYGYRILIQKIQLYARGNTWSCSSNFYRFAATRKDVASNSAVVRKLSGNRTVFIAPYASAPIGKDLWTTKDDIGIHNGYPYRFKGNENGQAIRNKARYFADWNNGLGYNILWFSTEPFNDYNYTIDAACVNCNSNDDENKAYIIQDTNDWEAIFKSKDSDNKNIVNYYDKGNGVYCREEYTIYFPNVNNTIYVEPGRYFTLNPSAKALNNVTSSPSIPNYKPVKVVKKRQCKVNTDENKGNATNILNNFRIDSEYDFKGKTGQVKFRYNEAYEDSRYNMDDAEVMHSYEEDNSYKYSLNNGMLEMEMTKHYTLPDNYYQYIRKQDGLSMKVKPSANLDYYINVGIPNLPVSFNNENDTDELVSKAGDIQFSYELPGKNNDVDKNSLLYKAYIKDNSYLSTKEKSPNIYNKYINNKMGDGDQELLNNSSCAKMFGINTAGFNTCARQRVNNAIGEGSNSCITKNEIGKNTTSGYSCMILMRDDCTTEEDASKQGLDWDPVNKLCCPVGTKYNPDLGKCSDETCRIENGKYYDFSGKEITKEEYDAICPADIPSICPTDKCPYGCCPSGECAPMPDGTCPGSGGKDVIYRTIDLENPFPGQNAEQRYTGSNWCSYDPKTRTVDCKSNNQTAINYITRERGGTVNGGKVYREDHVLYEVTLDTATINSIRSYNDKNKYDDWDLNCLDNGRACVSDFLRSVVKTTGECASTSKTNFYTCDEPV